MGTSVKVAVALVLVALCVATSEATVSGSSIANLADRYIGSTTWAKANSHRTGRNTWKCNIFVAEVLEAAGAQVPHRRWWSWTPIGAGEWGNSRSSYLTRHRCWSRVTNPQSGDVAGLDGHVGIVTGWRTTTSAGEFRVVKNDWGFRLGQSPVYWRYTC